MKVTQAILPIAGLGTRFFPWTKTVPKELLPLGNRPIIAHIVDECIHAGISDICFVINRNKELIPDYFRKDDALEEELRKREKTDALLQLKEYDMVKFHVAYQDEQLGDGHAVLQAGDWVDDAATAILFGDDLFTDGDSGLQQLLNAYDTIQDPHAAIMALEKIALEDAPRYGIIDLEHEHSDNSRIKKVKGLVEKPQPEDAPSNLGIVGRYIIPRSTFDLLPNIGAGHGGEIRLIDALIQQLGNTNIYGYECEGTRIDTGTPEGYAHAVQVFKNS